MKTCFKCNQTKSLSDFYKHKMMADGHLNKCKDCTKNDAHKHRYGPNREAILEYDRQRAYQPHRLEKIKEITKKYRQDNPKSYKAHILVNNALRDGKLNRFPCFVCGKKAEAHHPDYNRPLDVMWLCSSHHKQAHALVRKQI